MTTRHWVLHRYSLIDACNEHMYNECNEQKPKIKDGVYSCSEAWEVPHMNASVI